MSAWEHLAACRNAPDPDIFFNHHRLDEANRYCARCPVVLACREAGKTAYRGVWAGEWVKASGPGPSPTADYLPAAHGTEAGHARHIRTGDEPCIGCRAAHADYQRGKTYPSQRTAVTA